MVEALDNDFIASSARRREVLDLKQMKIDISPNAQSFYSGRDPFAKTTALTSLIEDKLTT